MKTKTFIRMIAMMLVLFMFCGTIPVLAYIYSPGPKIYELDRSRLLDAQKASIDENTIVLEAGGSINFDLLLPFDSDSLTITYSDVEDSFSSATLTVTTEKNSYQATLSDSATTKTVAISEVSGSNELTLSSNHSVKISGVSFGKVNENYNEHNSKDLSLTNYERAVLTSVIIKDNSPVVKSKGAFQRWNTDRIDLTPVNLEGRLYVPFKKFAEVLGFYSEEYTDKAYIYIQDEKQSMALIGGKGYIESDANGRHDFELKVLYKDGITWVPLRNLAEALGFTVCYKDGYVVIDGRLEANDIIAKDEIFSMIKADFAEFIDTKKIVGNIYHVAKSDIASDENDGTEAEPFKTLKKAAEVAEAGDTVIVHEGTYRETLAPENDGTATSPIIFKAAEGEDVLISALEPIAGFTTYDDKILKADVTEDLGFGRNQLFYKGKALNQGRHPNGDTKPGVVPYPADVPEGLYATRGNMRIMEENGNVVSSPTDLDQDDNYWVGGSYITLKGEGWCLVGGEITSSSRGELTVKDYDGTKSYNLGLTGSPNHNGTKYFTKVFESDYGYITNHLNTVDVPGEWYMNDNVLYMIPPEGADINKDFEIKQRQLAIDLRNRKYVMIKGIDTIGGGITMSGDETTGCILDGGEFKYIAHHTALYDQSNYALYPDEKLHSFTSMKAGEAGICIDGEANAIVNSTIDYSSATGVTLFGKYHYLNNNKISNTSYSGGYPGGIWITSDRSKTSLEGVLFGGHVITENTVYNSGRSVFSMGSSKDGKAYAVAPLEIAYNRFYNGALTSRDTGVTYEYGFTGGNDRAKTRMHHNYVYNAGYKDEDTKDVVFLLYQDGLVAARDTYCNVAFYTEADKTPAKQIFEQSTAYTVLRCRNNSELGYIESENEIKKTDYHGARPFEPGCDHDKYERSLENFNDLRGGVSPYYPSQKSNGTTYVFENIKIKSEVKTAINLYLNRVPNKSTSVGVTVRLYGTDGSLKKTVESLINAYTEKFYVYELHKGLIVLPEIEAGTYKVEIEFADTYSDLSRMIVEDYDPKYDNLYTKEMESEGITPYYPASVEETNNTKIVTFKDVEIESGSNTAFNLHMLRPSGADKNLEITAEMLDESGGEEKASYSNNFDDLDNISATTDPTVVTAATGLTFYDEYYKATNKGLKYSIEDGVVKILTNQDATKAHNLSVYYEFPNNQTVTTGEISVRFSIKPPTSTNQSHKVSLPGVIYDKDGNRKVPLQLLDGIKATTFATENGGINTQLTTKYSAYDLGMTLFRRTEDEDWTVTYYDYNKTAANQVLGSWDLAKENFPSFSKIGLFTSYGEGTLAGYGVTIDNVNVSYKKTQVQKSLLANKLEHKLNNSYEALNGMVVIPPVNKSGKYTVKLTLSDTYSDPIRMITQKVGSEYDPLFNTEVILGGSYDSWTGGPTGRIPLSKSANLDLERIAEYNHYAAGNCWDYTLVFKNRQIKENANTMRITYSTGDVYIGSTIKVYADSLDSDPIASLTLDKDVKWKATSADVTLTRELKAGTHTFYLKFVNGTADKLYCSTLYNFSFGDSIDTSKD